MKRSLNEFEILKNKALKAITSSLKKKRSVTFTNIKYGEDIPIELYEMPTYHYYRKIHYLERVYIWKIEMLSERIVAYSYSVTYNEIHIFYIDELDWSTVIEIGNLLDDDSKRSYIILNSDNEWIATGNNKTTKNIAADIAKYKKQYPASELIIYYTNDSEVL